VDCANPELAAINTKITTTNNFIRTTPFLA
jgi:hypothetical protein